MKTLADPARLRLLSIIAASADSEACVCDLIEPVGLSQPTVSHHIGAAYFFTSSTSFANPAITIGRTFSDTFAGIAPASVLPYIAAPPIGGALGWALVRILFPVAAPDPAVPQG